MRWKDPDTGYSLWLLERPAFNFQLLRSPASALSNTPFGVPALQDFREMWAAWDFVTEMIPDSMMFEKPIDLRHICLFYTGHIPAFLDIHLSNLLGEPNTEPVNFKVRLVLTFPVISLHAMQYIFERGIDPNVDDPTKCHVSRGSNAWSCILMHALQQPHSEVPEKDEDWPSHSTILDFQERVRARLSSLYAELESGRRQLTRKIARVLFMTLEHEAYHTEVGIFTFFLPYVIHKSNHRHCSICLYSVPGPAQSHHLWAGLALLLGNRLLRSGMRPPTRLVLPLHLALLLLNLAMMISRLTMHPSM